MPDANTTETQGMSVNWRTVCLLTIGSLEGFLIWWSLSHPMSPWRALMVVLTTLTLAATANDIVTKGRPTRFAFCFWLAPVLCGFVRDIDRVWNHYPGVDPMSTILFGAFNVLAVVSFIVGDPFGPKKTIPVTIKRNFT